MKKFLIVLCLLMSACNTTNISDAGEINEDDEYRYYIVVCKHPLGHVMRHVVDGSNWRNTYGSRSGVFRFRDVDGIYHENSMGCYTNDKIRVDKNGNLKTIPNV
mgnify:CR=1 FL=1